MDFAGVPLLRCRPADDRAQRDERRPAGLRLGLHDRLVQRLHVLVVLPVGRVVPLPPVDRLHVEAVRLVAGRDVFALGDARVVFDGDLVVVVDDHEIAQPLVPGERAHLVADALLDVAVGAHHVDVMVEHALAVRRLRVEQAPLPPCGHRHADRVAEPLPERAGGGLDPGGVPVLGVAGGQRVPLPQRLEILQAQAVAGQVELDVQGEAGVSTREHETIAADPQWIGGVMSHDPLEQQIGGGRQAHGGAGVAVAGLLDRVHGQDANRVDRPPVNIGPGQLGTLSEICGHGGVAPVEDGGAVTTKPCQVDPTQVGLSLRGVDHV